MSTESSDAAEGTSTVLPTAEVDFADTPVEELRQQEDNEGVGYPDADSRILLSTWADYHGVYHPFLPLAYRHSDPIDVGVTIADAIGAFPVTQKWFTRNQINIGNVTADIASGLLHRHRAPVEGQTAKRNRYRNPTYCHYDEWFDPIEEQEARREFYSEYIEVGVSPEWIASQLGFTLNELRQFVTEHTDHPQPAEHLRRRRATLAKTAYTTLVWSSWTVSDVSRALNTAPSCLRGWIQEHVRNTEWQPPDRPTEKEWFPHAVEEGSIGATQSRPSVDTDQQ